MACQSVLHAFRHQHASAKLRLQVLEGHNDEIWHVTFSHDGRLVGSASRDGTACLWRVKASGDAVLLHTLQGSPESLAAEKRSLSFLAFSPDDGLLLTCGAEPKVSFSAACRHVPRCDQTVFVPGCL